MNTEQTAVAIIILVIIAIVEFRYRQKRDGTRDAIGAFVWGGLVFGLVYIGYNLAGFLGMMAGALLIFALMLIPIFFKRFKSS